MNMKQIPKEDSDLEKFLLSLLAQLKEIKRLKEPMFRDITDYVYPRRAGWSSSDDDSGRSGSKIFDGSAVASLNRLSDGLFAWLVSPSVNWLKLEPKDRSLLENIPLMMYLRKVEDHLYDTFRSSNFYDAIAEDIADGCALGTAVITVDNDEDNGRPVYIPIHIREFYLSENRFGNVDVMMRELEMTYRQCVDTFSEEGDTLTDQFKKKAKQTPEAKVTVLHAVYPTGLNGIFKNNMPYASVYIMMGNAKDTGQPISQGIIRKGGYKYKRFLAWRFRHISGQVYGGCAPMDAMYDIKMLNIQAKTMSDSEQLAAKPPILSPETMRGKIKVAPGSVIYHNGEGDGNGIRPLFNGANLNASLEAMQYRQRIIQEHFKTDYFMSVSQIQNSSRERTREEILQMKAESAAVLGSIVGRINSERLEPLIRLTMAIEMEHERLPRPPKEVLDALAAKGLNDIALAISFDGPLATAQKKYIAMNGITESLQSIGGLAQLFGPDIMYNLDGNKIAREIVKTGGLRIDLMNEIKKVQDMQKQAAQGRADQAKAQMQLEMVKATGKSTTAPEPGSMAEMATGGMQ